MAETPNELQPEAVPEKQESTPVTAEVARFPQVKESAIKRLKSTGIFLEKSALYLFMVFLPLVITGYPAYLIINTLKQGADVPVVEAKLTSIDINKVQEGETGVFPFKSKGRTDVTLYFKGVDGRKYHAVVEMPWTSPGLRKQMDAKYGDRESFTLYPGKDGTVEFDEQVAGNRMSLLSILMALVLLTCGLAIFLRHRLSERMPSLVTHESAANSRSIIYGQLITLMVTFAFTVVMHFTPVVVSATQFLGLYWGVAVVLAVSLRLLVFQNPPPPPPVPEENPRDRGFR